MNIAVSTNRSTRAATPSPPPVCTRSTSLPSTRYNAAASVPSSFRNVTSRTLIGGTDRLSVTMQLNDHAPLPLTASNTAPLTAAGNSALPADTFTTPPGPPNAIPLSTGSFFPPRRSHPSTKPSVCTGHPPALPPPAAPTCGACGKLVTTTPAFATQRSGDSTAPVVTVATCTASTAFRSFRNLNACTRASPPPPSSGHGPVNVRICASFDHRG